MATTITAERRRNLRPENCRACSKPCDAGQGYLYRDTNTSRRSRTGRFLWFVKCEECHEGAKTRTTVSLEKRSNARALSPAIRPWSVSQAKRWLVERIAHDGDVAIQIDAGAFVEVVSYRHRVNSRFTAPTGYELEQMDFAGKPLSERAASHLSDQILAIVKAVQDEERTAGEEAVARLIAAGATASLCVSGHGWRVDFGGAYYTLWGCVDRKNKVVGVGPQGWVETTAEELLASAPAD